MEPVVMRRLGYTAALVLALAGCSHRRLNPVTVKVAPPQPVYLQPAEGRVVNAVLVDLPPDPGTAHTPAAATPSAPHR